MTNKEKEFELFPGLRLSSTAIDAASDLICNHLKKKNGCETMSELEFFDFKSINVLNDTPQWSSKWHDYLFGCVNKMDRMREVKFFLWGSGWLAFPGDSNEDKNVVFDKRKMLWYLGVNDVKDVNFDLVKMTLQKDLKKLIPNEILNFFKRAQTSWSADELLTALSKKGFNLRQSNEELQLQLSRFTFRNLGRNGLFKVYKTNGEYKEPPQIINGLPHRVFKEIQPMRFRGQENINYGYEFENRFAVFLLRVGESIWESKTKTDKIDWLTSCCNISCKSSINSSKAHFVENIENDFFDNVCKKTGKDDFMLIQPKERLNVAKSVFLDKISKDERKEILYFGVIGHDENRDNDYKTIMSFEMPNGRFALLSSKMLCEFLAVGENSKEFLSWSINSKGGIKLNFKNVELMIEKLKALMLMFKKGRFGKIIQ